MKKLVVMSMIACMAFSMTACGSKEEAPAQAPAEEGTEAPAESTEGTEPAEDAAAPEDKEWIIAMDTVFRPFEFTDENGNFVGIDVDVLDAVAKDQGFNYAIESLGWDAAVAAV